MKNLRTAKETTVTQLQYLHWRDNEAPSEQREEQHFEAISYILREIHLIKMKQEHQNPVMVHCSAGIGRTGTLLAIYNIVQAIDKLQDI